MQSLGILPWGAGGHYSEADKITKWNSLNPTRVQNRARPPCALVQASPRVSRGQLGRESRGRDRRGQEPPPPTGARLAEGPSKKKNPPPPAAPSPNPQGGRARRRRRERP